MADPNGTMRELIEDCVAGSTYDAHEASLRAMEYLQSGARRSLDEVVAAMRSYVSDVGRAPVRSRV